MVENSPCRDRPELIFINSAKPKRDESSNVVSAENETEAEFNTFRPKPKAKINNAECIGYVYNPKRLGYINAPSML